MENDNVSQGEMDLISIVLCEHFGQRCAHVAMTLFGRGRASLAELRNATSYAFLELRSCLTVLIQHNVVAYNSIAETVFYSLKCREILYRTRFARYALFVHQHYGAVARMLFVEVLKRGRVTLGHLVTHVLHDYEKSGDDLNIVVQEAERITKEHSEHKANKDDGEQDEEDGEGISSTKGPPLILKESTLKKEYVPVVNQDHSHKGSDVPRPKNKKRKDPKASKSKTPTVDPALEAALDTHKLSSCDVRGPHGSPPFPSNDTVDFSDMPSMHLQRPALDALALIDRIEQENVLFRVNVPFMNFVLLREMAENLMAARWGESRIVRYITRVLLQSARIDASEKVITEGRTFSDIRQQLEKLSASGALGAFRAPEPNILLQLFDVLDRTDRIIRNVTCDGVALFIFDWDRFRCLMLDRVLFNAIVARHGEKAGRVWGLLRSAPDDVTDPQTPKLWEDQQIADQALLPPNVARDLLYRLSSSGFVRMHQSDLVTGAPASFSSKHGLVFYASVNMAKAQLLQETYTTLLNLWQRKEHEKREIAQLICGNPRKAVLKEGQLHQREAGEDRLEYTFLHLDATAVLTLRDMA